MQTGAPQEAQGGLVHDVWEAPALPGKAPLAREIAAFADFPEWATALLVRQGIRDVAARERYLRPSLQTLPDPMQMADMRCAIDRLLRALRANELIVVYGDYDVDGVCAAALLVSFLRSVGGRADFYIPDRRQEGYGLNAEAIRGLSARTGLVVTVDCGITACDEVALANTLGTDVIIVDHHQLGAALPKAVACLNPHRPDCPYPFKGLCAAGVAFMLAMALRRRLRESRAFVDRPEPDARSLLDLVAVATVADMVPLCDVNRVLVVAGMQRLRQAPRLGLRALCDVAGVVPAHLDAADLGFRIGPRINARGRMGSAMTAVTLMLSDDAAQARRLASELDAANGERRNVEQTTLQAALSQIDTQTLHPAAALVLQNETWHPGVLGLVASRVAAKFGRPTVVIGEGGKGSGRSVEGFDLHAALQQSHNHLLRFGGHPMAAGVTVEAAAIPAFQQSLAALAQAARGAPPYPHVLRPDVALPAEAIGDATLQWLQWLGPFGQGNPEPLFVAHGLRVRSKRLVGRNHLKLALPEGVEAIGFDMGGLLERITAQVDVAFCLQRNTFSGQTRVQLRLRDLRPCERLRERRASG